VTYRSSAPCGRLVAQRLLEIQRSVGVALELNFPVGPYAVELPRLLPRRPPSY
jgi:hypothetical protein